MERELKKEGDRYVFKVIDKANHFKQEKSYKKDELIEIYQGLIKQTNNLNDAIGDNKRVLKTIEIEDNEELRKFLELLTKAEKLKEKEKIEKNLQQQEAQKVMFEEQIKEIKVAIPEADRAKKV
jgi:hypothetical protein